MPVKNRNKGVRVKYTKDQFEAALKEVKRGVPSKDVAVKFNIPLSTLNKHREKENFPGAGRNPVLSEQDETTLAVFIKLSATHGEGLTKHDIINYVQTYVNECNLKTPWKDGKPGDEWFLGFMKRHPKLSQRKAESMPSYRVEGSDPFVIYQFFDDIRRLFQKLGIKSLKDAWRLLNADETAFRLDPSNFQVIAQKGEKRISKNIAGSGKDCTTVLTCGGADGTKLPPLIVYQGTYVWSSWISDEDYPGTGYTAQSKGWMEGTLFCHWFETLFLQNVPSKEERKGVKLVLFFDGASCHINVRIVKSAIKNDVVLVKLPPNVTQYLQPLDLCVFKPLKNEWEQLVRNHSRQNSATVLDKKHFSKLLRSAWEDGFKSKNLRAGFEATGLFPLDETKFPKTAFHPDKLERYMKMKVQEKTTTTSENPSGEPAAVASTSSEHPNVPSTPSEHPSVPSTSTEHSSVPPVSSEHPSLSPTCSEHLAKPSASGELLTANTSSTSIESLPGNTNSTPPTTPPTPTSDFESFLRTHLARKNERESKTSGQQVKGRKLSNHKGEILTSKTALKRLEKLEAAKANSAKKKATPKQPTKRMKKAPAKSRKKKPSIARLNFSDDSSSDPDKPTLELADTDDSLDPETFSDLEKEDEGSETEDKIDIRLEKYYAIYYDINWYLGRVVDFFDESESKVKFLKSELDKYVWPKSNDIQTVNNRYIFYGPLDLKGSEPFELKRSDLTVIKRKFSLLRQTFKSNA